MGERPMGNRRMLMRGPDVELAKMGRITKNFLFGHRP